jgi:hypothetical protein
LQGCFPIDLEIVNSYNIKSNIWKRRYGSMNKVLIECGALIDKYRLNKENILKLLESMNIEKGAKNFIIGYTDDPCYTLIGEINGNQVVLTNIEKAIAFEEMDNTDLYEFIKKVQDL